VYNNSTSEDEVNGKLNRDAKENIEHIFPTVLSINYRMMSEVD